MDIVQNIIEDYYSFLRQYFTTRAPRSKTDQQLVEDNIDEFKKVWPHFKHLPSIIEEFMTWDEAGKDIKYPYIGVFVKHGLLEKMAKKSYEFDQMEKIQIEKTVAAYVDNLRAIMKEEGSNLGVEVDAAVGKVDFYKGDPKYGDSFFTTTENNVLLRHYYDEIQKEIGK